MPLLCLDTVTHFWHILWHYLSLNDSLVTLSLLSNRNIDGMIISDNLYGSSRKMRGCILVSSHIFCIIGQLSFIEKSVSALLPCGPIFGPFPPGRISIRFNINTHNGASRG